MFRIEIFALIVAAIKIHYLINCPFAACFIVQHRQSLVFIDEEVAEDPQEGTQLQMPHLKGAAIEDMLFTVYRRYCG